MLVRWPQLGSRWSVMRLGLVWLVLCLFCLVYSAGWSPKLNTPSQHGSPLRSLSRVRLPSLWLHGKWELEDRLFRRGNTPPLPWQLRFPIAAEIGTGLLFLHQTKPEPIVHRDLKPANILLDSNFVSKISDVGLARLVPPNVTDCVTQYHMTSAAGTFCYIDPEYQQTGMLRTKSDIYSLGIWYHAASDCYSQAPNGFDSPSWTGYWHGYFCWISRSMYHDWPVEEALNFAQLALKCAELRRKDRPDLKS